MTQKITATLRIAHPSKAPARVYGEYFEVDNEDPDGLHWVRKVEREIDFSGCDPDSAIELIRGISEGLSRARFEMDTWTDEVPTVRINGQRPVTEEEQQWIDVGIAAATQRKRDQASYVHCARCQVRHLPPEHPMLSILENRT